MALDSNTAFGRYLRTLRERRPLSLDEVESLSSSFADSINKGYLSRCENGRQAPAFRKVIALSRIYEVPPDVLIERMELDMELERLGGPDTEDQTFAELYKQAKDRLEHGAVWDAYALARDASFVAHTDPVVPNFSDRKEQVLWACMNVATVAAKLGRFQYARWEFEYVNKTKGSSSTLRIVIPERLAHINRELGRFHRAREYADQAVVEAESSSMDEYLSYVYFTRARLADDEGDPSLASTFYQKAFRVDKRRGLERECAIDLLNLAQSYLHLNRVRSARRSLDAALKMAIRLASQRTEGFVWVLLGEVEEAEGRKSQAVTAWRRASAIARALNDRLLRFKAELRLYRRALLDDEGSTARAVERRLRRLAPWIPEHTAEAREFKNLSSAQRATAPRRVAESQPRLTSVDNEPALHALPNDRRVR